MTTTLDSIVVRARDLLPGDWVGIKQVRSVGTLSDSTRHISFRTGASLELPPNRKVTIYRRGQNVLELPEANDA